MLEAAEAVCEAAGLLDEQVDRFGATVVDPAGGEVGEDLLTPLAQVCKVSRSFSARCRPTAGVVAL